MSVQTLRFHYDLYSSRAIEHTLEVFADHAELTLRQAPPYYEVDVSAAEAEAVVAGELANYALALTVEEKRGGRAAS